MIYIKSIQLHQFRNFEHAVFSFEKGLNHIIGQNGLGKTNLLEALHFFSTGRSFRTTNPLHLIQKGKSHFTLKMTFDVDGLEHTLEVQQEKSKKTILHNKTPYKSYTKLLGLIPSVMYGVNDISFIQGSPAEKRRSLNIHMAQNDPRYAYHLYRYKKALEQRNALFKLSAKHIHAQATLWEQEMAKSAQYIREKRSDLIQRLEKNMQMHYEMLYNKDQQKEEPSIHYVPSIHFSEDPITADFWRKERNKDILLGCTTQGPHRDQFHVYLNQKLAKDFASEGQKRTLIAALKLAECQDLDNPLLFIDDFGVHLDQTRSHLMQQEIVSKHQVFITSPHPLSISKNHALIYLEKYCIQKN